MISHFVLLCLVLLASCGAPGCQHPIFCNQKILSAVAQSNFYPDSKTFVDLVLKVSVQQALRQFQTKPLYTFLQNCFTANNTILFQVNLTDWKQNPQSLSQISSPELKTFALDLNRRWNQLARAVDLNYKTDCPAKCSSFIDELNGRTIVIPGGRFQESYYWDTYWIIKGLIVCDMLQTAVHLIDNFIIVIQKYGFIPNGFRQYYLNRSQPPFFALMVKQLAQALRKKGRSVDADTVQQRSYPSLIAQHSFFMQSHSKLYKLKSGKDIRLNFYNANTTTARPESYREDSRLVQNIKDQVLKKNILKGISSMAESGWDFSSRWLNDSSRLETNLINSMIPSDLNTLMALLEEELVLLSAKYNRPDLVKYYQELISDRKNYFLQINSGQYGQYFPDTIERNPRPNIYPSDLYPFLLFPFHLNYTIYNDTVNPVSSSMNTGLQWDKPNVWAPNSWILHETTTNDKVKIGQQWVSTVYCSWKKQGLIYEKYRNDKLGERGQGGEYVVQTGFGWSNGLALYYLQLYATQLTAPQCP